MPVAKPDVTKNNTSMSKDLTVDTKNPIGRPSKYKPEYCEILIDEMAKGYSYEACAAVFDVCKDTLYEWEKEHPDFSYAKKKAFNQCRRFWEKLGIDHIVTSSETIREGKDQITTSKSLNPAVWIFNMKNRFRDEWKDKQEVDHRVNPGEKPPMALSYAIPEREVQEVEGEEHDS